MWTAAPRVIRDLTKVWRHGSENNLPVKSKCTAEEPCRHQRQRTGICASCSSLICFCVEVLTKISTWPELPRLHKHFWWSHSRIWFEKRGEKTSTDCWFQALAKHYPGSITTPSLPRTEHLECMPLSSERILEALCSHCLPYSAQKSRQQGIQPIRQAKGSEWQ